MLSGSPAGGEGPALEAVDMLGRHLPPAPGTHPGAGERIQGEGRSKPRRGGRMNERRPLWRRLYEGWLLVAAHFGEVQTLIVVGLVYALVIGPVALAIQVGRGDPLHKRSLRARESAWLEADSTKSPDLARAKRLF
jgi:hypothetical protein